MSYIKELLDHLLRADVLVNFGASTTASTIDLFFQADVASSSASTTPSLTT